MTSPGRFVFAQAMPVRSAAPFALVDGVGLHGHAVDTQFGKDRCVGAAGSVVNDEDFGAGVLFAQGPGKADQ